MAISFQKYIDQHIYIYVFAFHLHLQHAMKEKLWGVGALLLSWAFPLAWVFPIPMTNRNNTMEYDGWQIYKMRTHSRQNAENRELVDQLTLLWTIYDSVESWGGVLFHGWLPEEICNTTTWCFPKFLRWDIWKPLVLYFENPWKSHPWGHVLDYGVAQVNFLAGEKEITFIG